MPRYEIDKDNAVLVFYTDGQKVPGLYQPFDPSLETSLPFASKEEATTWADGYILALKQLEDSSAAIESLESSSLTVEEPLG